MLSKWIEEINKEDASIVGGKGANLGEMLKAGVSVPPAFIVTTKAYMYLLETGGFRDKIARFHEEIDIDDFRQLTRIGKEVRDLILSAQMPKKIADTIRKSYKKLCVKAGESEVFVAVRSSATTEDMLDASFAGQHSTYLNIKGSDSVIESVQKCWASLFTDRAIVYRKEHNIDYSKVLMSVIVQKMVNANAAGVAFTIHPVRDEKNVILIESSWGLGEIMVSGAITPDMFIVSKDTFKILCRKISDKEKMLIKDLETDRTIEQDVPPCWIAAQSISDNHIIELAKIAKRIENHFGFPQDIEWALENGLLYIVQTRPVTTL